MAEFNLDDARQFQSSILERVRGMERVLDREVLEYYRADGVHDEEDFYENLRGLHTYLKRAYDALDKMLDDIEYRRKR